MNAVVNILLFFLSLINIFIHSVGCYLLYSLFRNGKQNLQQFYLLHFSSCQVVINSLELFCCLLEMIPTSTIDFHELRSYMDIINIAGNGTVYYLITSYITIDRLCDILLNIRYPVYWSERKAFYLMISSWVTGLVVSVTFCLAYSLVNLDYYQVLFTYYFPIFNVGFLILVVVTYSFIFHRYRKTHSIPVVKKRRCGVVKKETPLLNPLTIYRNSRFHIPVLIISTFVLLKVIPDLIAQILKTDDAEGIEIMIHICMISYTVSGIVSAYIYVFVQEQIKKILYKKVRKIKWRLNQRRRERKKAIITLAPHLQLGKEEPPAPVDCSPTLVHWDCSDKSEVLDGERLPEWQKIALQTADQI